MVEFVRVLIHLRFFSAPDRRLHRTALDREVRWTGSGAMDCLLDSEGREEGQQVLRDFPALLAEAFAEARCARRIRMRIR